MSCCGRNRAALRATATTSGPGSVQQPAIRLRWRRRVTAVVDGPVSGQRYAVSADAPVIAVDRRDAVALLRTGFFERLG